MRVKVAVLVSGGGTNLQALLDANLQHGEIAFVLSNRKAAYALERARARGVETAVLSNVMEPDPVRRDEKLLEMLRARGIQVVALAGYLGILGEKTKRNDWFCGKRRKKFLDKPRKMPYNQEQPEIEARFAKSNRCQMPCRAGPGKGADAEGSPCCKGGCAGRAN